MITISVDPVIFSLGHIMIRWYSLIVLVAIAIGVWLTATEAERRGFKKEDIYDFGLTQSQLIALATLAAALPLLARSLMRARRPRAVVAP